MKRLRPNSRPVILAAAIALLVASTSLFASDGAAIANSNTRQTATTTPRGVAGSAPVSPRVPTHRVLYTFSHVSSPTISGTARVGFVLTAHAAGWIPTPTSLTYQWLRNGGAIATETNATYALDPSDDGTSVSVQVTASYPGFRPVTLTSSSHDVLPGIFASTPTPTISGTAKVGLTLTANTGSWQPTPDLLEYQWKSNGAPIPDATDPSYEIDGNQTGKKISVSVTATRTDFAPATKTSGSTGTVTVQIPIPKDGTYRVGVNLAPGTYVTKSSTDDCYWERVADFSGDLSSINANDFGSGQMIVTIDSSDVGFHTERCGQWLRLQDTPSPLKTRFGTGTYAVGQHIPTGTYEASESEDCYWATLSGFSGSLEEIIANDFGNTTVVQITDADVGFETNDCGTWTRIGS